MTEKKIENSLLTEVAWEVCNQVGGIYTVIRSKVGAMVQSWGDDYCLLGPYVHPNVSAIFEPTDNYDDPIGQAVKNMQSMGFEVYYGRWLVTGRPKTVLFNPFSVFDRLGEIKYLLWENHHISIQAEDDLLNQVVAFGHMVAEFYRQLGQDEVRKGHQLIAHIHEWMAGSGVPAIRRDVPDVQIVFTTHATLLGRYLAMNADNFYEHLDFFDWEKESRHFNIEAQARLERAAAHGAHVFTTVSEVTGRECDKLLGRKPDMILPNGLNISRFAAEHEIQNLHQEYKEEIHKFIMGHFFHSYSFDLDKTLFFFTSGRFEHKNKGFDLTLEALARLNWKMKQAHSDMRVVMFIITKAPFHSINPEVLQSRATMEEIRENTRAIERQIGDRLFSYTANSKDTTMPDLNKFVDDYWRLRLRRTVQSWRATQWLPPIVTHNLKDDAGDPILNFLRSSDMINKEEDPVKIVYHPDFISSVNPLFGIEYGDFVRGCHLGIFPSYYEPWGYTPLECMASGVMAVTSDLSGFGAYAANNVPHPEENGLYIVNRSRLSYHEAANQLADQLFAFVRIPRHERIQLRYKVERAAERFDWKNLVSYYDQAHAQAVS
ncbi:MAG: glycosyltransferase [Bacteroidota bacterium]